LIVIKANPGRVEEVAFTGDTAAERAIESEVWRAVRPIIDLLDRKLQRLNRAVVAELSGRGRR
jgi:hypothetical protein